MTRSIEEELAVHGHSFFQTVGDSMEPLLHNRCSTVVIEKKKDRLKRYDVALYRRPDGKYILHRVLRVTKHGYIIRGDNRIWRETVPEEWVLGVMVGFYAAEADGFTRSTQENTRLYWKKYRLRRWFIWLRSLPGRLKRKLFG